MKVVILAGGLGERIKGETKFDLKPMIEIGGKSILWHIMKIYSAHNINDFVICYGNKGDKIKDYFENYVNQELSESWNIEFVDTGLETMTGGRIKRIRDYVDKETFCLTYGDGLANVNISELINFHNKQKTLATVTAVHPPSEYGNIKMENNRVCDFKEKPIDNERWVNGGFFVLEDGIFDYIKGDSVVWENEPLENLTKDHELSAYQHNGFWQSLDTLKDKKKLDEYWISKKPPWKIW